MLIIEWIFKLFPQSFLHFIELIIYGIRSGPVTVSAPVSAPVPAPVSVPVPAPISVPVSAPVPASVSDLLYTVSDFPLTVQDFELPFFVPDI